MWEVVETILCVGGVFWWISFVWFLSALYRARRIGGYQAWDLVEKE